MQPKRLFGQRVLDEDVWQLALRRTRSAFEQFDNVLVSFSGGKDSTVVLNAALQVGEDLGRLPVRVCFYDEEAIPYETEEYARRVSRDPRVAFEWYCLPVQHRNACSLNEPYWWPWAPEARDLWCRPLPPEAIIELEGFSTEPPSARPTIPGSSGLLAPVSRYGSVGLLMGIRADESLTRRRAVGNTRAENWVLPGYDSGPNVFKCYPIYDMSTVDVWTAPARFGWDYNRAYDVMEMIGIPHHAQRCAPPYGEQPMQRLWTYKQVAPELWERMLARVPGAQTAALYSTTDLFSYGDAAEKPDDLTWQEYLAQRVARWEEPHVRAHVANRVQVEIRNHYRKTSDPIVSVPHPFTGVSWKWLYRLADRGDLKSRAWPEYGKGTWDAYNAARAAECQ